MPAFLQSGAWLAAWFIATLIGTAIGNLVTYESGVRWKARRDDRKRQPEEAQ